MSTLSEAKKTIHRAEQIVNKYNHLKKKRDQAVTLLNRKDGNTTIGLGEIIHKLLCDQDVVLFFRQKIIDITKEIEEMEKD